MRKRRLHVRTLAENVFYVKPVDDAERLSSANLVYHVQSPRGEKNKTENLFKVKLVPGVISVTLPLRQL